MRAVITKMNQDEICKERAQQLKLKAELKQREVEGKYMKYSMDHFPSATLHMQRNGFMQNCGNRIGKQNAKEKKWKQHFK